MSDYYKKLFNNIIEPQKNLSLSLFNSEGFYWLTTAIAIGFATEELVEFQKKYPQYFSQDILPRGSQPFIEMFKESVKSGETSKAVEKEAQQTALANLKILANYAKQTREFAPLIGVILGKTYATYWLIYKLIEVEWQQILDLKEIEETYILLDTVLMDHEELEQLEQRCKENQVLSQDDKLYLRSHFNRVKSVWPTLFNDLQLLAGGWISYSAPYNINTRV